MEAMMKRDTGRLILAGALILLGLLFLLQNFSLINTAWAGIWAIIFVAGGVAFIAVYLRDHNSWWALIPGCALLGIGIITGIEAVAPASVVQATGGIFLGLIGVAFLMIYLTRRENWWAVIPAGALFTLAAVATISPYYAGPATGAIFFFGIAATFLALYVLPDLRHRQPWAIWPAIACAGLGLVTLLSEVSAGAWLWPLILIAVGGYLFFRWYRSAERS
jgi:hypothetical protein